MNTERKSIYVPIQKGLLKGKKVFIPPPLKGKRNITPSLLKESMFQLIENFFGTSFDGSRQYFITFFDLCAGSGQIGIEALSRGFSQVHIVEKDKNRFDFILNLLKGYQIKNSKLIFHNKDFLRFAKIIPKEKDSVAFIDPPYSFWKNNQYHHLDFFFKKFFECLKESPNERKKILFIIQSPIPYELPSYFYPDNPFHIQMEFVTKHYRKHFLNLIKINLTK
ncbi:MAG: RsmD family RNA methyltransferase [Leptonema sp. (in: bacteria)]